MHPNDATFRRWWCLNHGVIARPYQFASITRVVILLNTGTLHHFCRNCRTKTEYRVVGRPKKGEGSGNSKTQAGPQTPRPGTSADVGGKVGGYSALSRSVSQPELSLSCPFTTVKYLMEMMAAVMNSQRRAAGFIKEQRKRKLAIQKW